MDFETGQLWVYFLFIYRLIGSGSRYRGNFVVVDQPMCKQSDIVTVLAPHAGYLVSL